MDNDDYKTKRNEALRGVGRWNNRFKTASNPLTKAWAGVGTLIAIRRVEKIVIKKIP